MTTATQAPRTETPAALLELRALRQWVTWKREKRGGQETKVPYTPSGRRAKTNDPRTWSTFDECAAAVEADSFDGVGFVFSASDPFVGVDLDHVLDAEGRPNDLAVEVVAALDSYAERSPSGDGLHIILKGELPRAMRDLGLGVEVYARGRFFTVTGAWWPDAPEIIEERTTELRALVERLGKARGEEGPKTNGGAKLGPGSRHNALVARAATLRKAGYGRVELDAALVAFNAAHCAPPLPADEVREIAAWSAEAVKPVDEEERAASQVADVANAIRLVKRFGGELRWVRGVGWLAFDGTRWKESETEALRRATQLGRIIQAEAAEIEARAAQVGSDGEREKLGAIAEAFRDWAKRSEGEPRIRAALNLARAYLELPVDALDADPWLLNCPNGTVHLPTGELRGHRASDYITRCTAAAYKPGARSELLEAVLAHALPDPAARDFLQRVAGYTACGVCGEDVLVTVYGPTRTSKGTVQGAIAAALGDYAATAGLEDFAERDRSGGPRPELARLRGARMVSVYETGKRLKVDLALLKTLAGSDPLTVRGLYKEPITFAVTFTTWIASNHHPRVDADDDAAWERIREVPFRVPVGEADRKPDVRRRLADPEDCGPAVLSWIVEGGLAWQREGLTPPDAVRMATSSYREEMDRLGPWLAACCVLHPDAWASAAELRKSYEKFCEEIGEKPIAGRSPAWADGLRRHGAEREKRHPGHGWRGIGLAEQGTVTS